MQRSQQQHTRQAHDRSHVDIGWYREWCKAFAISSSTSCSRGGGQKQPLALAKHSMHERGEAQPWGKCRLGVAGRDARPRPGSRRNGTARGLLLIRPVFAWPLSCGALAAATGGLPEGGAWTASHRGATGRNASHHCTGRGMSWLAGRSLCGRADPGEAVMAVEMAEQSSSVAELNTSGIQRPKRTCVTRLTLPPRRLRCQARVANKPFSLRKPRRSRRSDASFPAGSVDLGRRLRAVTRRVGLRQSVRLSPPSFPRQRAPISGAVRDQAGWRHSAGMLF